MGETTSVGKTLTESYSLTNLRKSEVTYKSCKTYKSQQEVSFLLEKMDSAFKNPGYEPVYRKAAWYLSESEIINIMEKASASSIINKPFYFVRSLRNALRDKLALNNG